MNLLKYRELETEIRQAIGVHCRVKLTKGKTIGAVIDLANGGFIPGTGTDVVTGETGYFHNIITNNGMNKLADNVMNGVSNYCHCGTGTASETATDTSLETFLAATNTVNSSSSTEQVTPPYYAEYVRTFRFAQGAAEGNISEVGFSDQATTGDLFSRARVKNVDGTPTTIAVLDDEWLDVTYEFRLYPDHVLSNGGEDDGEGTISISGDSYNYTIRPAYITNGNYWAAAPTQAQFRTVDFSWAAFFSSASTLGAVTSEPSNPSGSAATSADSSISAATYSSGTFTRNISLEIGLNDGNASGGVGAMRFHTGMGTYQIAFDPVVPKDATKVWTFVTNLLWARATIP